VLDDESADGEEVRDVGDAGAFADLVAMQARGIDEGVVEAVGEGHGWAG
jgi:hypothetical protein